MLNKYSMNYFSPQIKFKDFISNGFGDLWFIARSPYKRASFREHIIRKLDDYNYLAVTKYPYNLPKNSLQFMLHTLNNLSVDDVIKMMRLINIITDNDDFMIWHDEQTYYIIVRPKVISKNLLSVLHKMIIIARHGPREPILCLPKLRSFHENDASFDNRVMDAQLTPYGIEYCYKFGKYIRNLFDKYIQFDQKTTVLYSSKVNRTKESAINFYKGLFHDKAFDDKQCNISDTLVNLSKLLDEKLKKLYDEFHDKLTLNSVNEEITSNIENILGYKINKISDYYSVFSTVDLYVDHDINLPDNWSYEMMIQLREIAIEYYYKLFNKTIFCDVFTEDLFDLINQLLNNENINFAYLSTHDVILYPLAFKINGYKVKLPEFCSSVRYELWSSGLRIYYDDLLIKD